MDPVVRQELARYQGRIAEARTLDACDRLAADLEDVEATVAVLLIDVHYRRRALAHGQLEDAAEG